jgi:predicted GNAT family acetyltransferase
VTHPEELQRALAFEARVTDGAADEVSVWEYGIAVITTALPRVWDANQFRLGDNVDAAAGDIAASAAEIAADAKLNHVAIVAPQEQAEALWPGLEPLGYDRTRFVYMALRRRPDSPSQDVAEVTAGDVAASRAEMTLEFFPGNHELVDQLAELDRRLARTIGGRWFAIRDDGQVAARAWLLGADGVGQVEDVATTPAKRSRGYARAVVSAAALASLDAGDELTFIVADADDAVTRLYRSIGFEPLGITERFVRPLKR